MFYNKKLSHKFSINNRSFDSVYHYHIQKTGGTSINEAFLSLLYTPKLLEEFEQLRDAGKLTDGQAIPAAFCYSGEIKDRYFKGNNYAMASHNLKTINSRKWFFAHSHESQSDVKIRKKCYTFTVLRDPVERLISRYCQVFNVIENGKKNLLDMKLTQHPDKGIKIFAENYPQYLTKNQLYLFSKSLEVEEAVNNLLNCNQILMQVNLKEDFLLLSKVVGLNSSLGQAKSRKTDFADYPVSEAEKDWLKDYLDDEYKLLEKIRPIYLEKKALVNDNMI